MHFQHVDAFLPNHDEDGKNGLIIRWAGHYFRNSNSYLKRVHNRYYLLYVYEGIGYILNKQGEQETLEKGSLVLFLPGELQCLWADSENPFSYYGTCFCGSFVDFLLKDTLICEKTHHLQELDKRFLSQMQSFLNLLLLNQNGQNKLSITSHFFLLLSSANTLVTYAQECKNEKYPIENAIEKVEQYLLLHYSETMDIHTLADVSGYSTTWINHHFKGKFGTTPMNYLTDIRLRKAKQLLCMSEGEQMNISEIAYAVGYKDALYFSKAFKKSTGVSPKQYRNAYTIPPEEYT